MSRGGFGASKQAVLFDLKQSAVQDSLHYVWHQEFQTGSFIWNLESVQKGKRYHLAACSLMH